MRRFILIAALFSLVIFGSVAFAADAPRLNVPIGALTTVPADPGSYINTIYKWGLGLAALVALARLVMGGVLKTLSAGNVAEEGAANEVIKDGFYGLIILVSIALVLSTINPKLLNIDLPNLAKIDIQETPAIDARDLGPSALYPDATPDQVKPYQRMYDSITNYVNRKKAGALVEIHDVTGWQGSESSATGDFYEYMTAASVADQRHNIEERDQYRTAVLNAVKYARRVMDPADFKKVTEIMNSQAPASLYAPEYLKENPVFPELPAASTKNPDEERALILKEVESLNKDDQAVFAKIKKYVDDDDYFRAADSVVANAYAKVSIQVIQLSVNYAKTTFASERYGLFERKLRNDRIFDFSPELNLPPE